MRKGLNIIIVLALLFCVNAVFAQMHENKEEKGAMVMVHSGMNDTICNDENCGVCMGLNMMIKNAENFGLTKDQLDKIDALRMDAKKENIKKQADLDIMKIDTQRLMMEDKINLDELKVKIKKISEIEGEVRYICIEAMINSRKTLTDEQRSKVKEMMKSNMGKMNSGCMMRGGMMSGDKKTDEKAEQTEEEKKE